MSKNTTKDTQPTNSELLTVIQSFANNSEQRLQNIEATNNELFNFVHGFADYVQTNMVTKDEFYGLQNEFYGLKQQVNDHQTILENIATNVNKIQEDHMAVIDWLKRHNQQLENHDLEFKHIKFQLNGV